MLKLVLHSGFTTGPIQIFQKNVVLHQFSEQLGRKYDY